MVIGSRLLNVGNEFEYFKAIRCFRRGSGDAEVVVRGELDLGRVKAEIAVDFDTEGGRGVANGKAGGSS